MTRSNAAVKIDQVDAFHKTKKGRLVFGVAELLVAYLFVSLAIDSGSLWQYGLSALLIIGGANNLVRAINFDRTKTNGKKPARKR